MPEEPIFTSDENRIVPVQGLYPTVRYILDGCLVRGSDRLLESKALEGLQASPTEHLDY